MVPWPIINMINKTFIIYTTGQHRIKRQCKAKIAQKICYACHRKAHKQVVTDSNEDDEYDKDGIKRRPVQK